MLVESFLHLLLYLPQGLLTQEFDTHTHTHIYDIFQSHLIMLTLNKLYQIEHCEIIGLCKYLPEYHNHQTLTDEKI